MHNLYLVTFYKEDEEAEVIKHQTMNDQEVMKMYEHMLDVERLNVDFDNVQYPSKLFEVHKLQMVTDNS